MKKLSQREKEKILINLKQDPVNSYIAFVFDDGNSDRIIVSNIENVYGTHIVVRFMIGNKPKTVSIKYDNIIGVRSEKGDTFLSGWSSRFIIINPDLLVKVPNYDSYSLKEKL